MDKYNLDAEDLEHDNSSLQTPLREDAFKMTDDLKIELIEKHFREIMHILGLDLTDDSLQGTPRRVAKMYVNEIFRGLNPDHKPHAKLFQNRFAYNQMLVERNITLYSYCEHHFVPIIGKAHVAYIPDKHVVGLSKLNRIVQYYAKRPQVQERLTMQIADELKSMLFTDNVAVFIEADHLCVMSRGVNDVSSSTITTEFSGLFQQEQYRNEFLAYIRK
jgi:GTP cyclohydrolase IA